LAAKDAEFLRRAILDVVASAEAALTDSDAFGSRYLLDFELTRGSKKAMIRTAWIVRRGENFPRLLTCYVL
jgi:hypothetical protein